jgi:TPP-dependent pyruvate/acetoin dehydrogenase alpha subunit
MPPPAETSTAPASAPELGEDTALAIYKTMATIRAAEDRIVRGLRSGELRMTFYPVRGQEAIPACVSAHLRADDYMVTTYRGMHDCIAKGIPLDELMAEMCGRITGTSKGKGGPMHLSDPRSGLMVTTGVVGGGLPISLGLALASKLRGTDQVTVVNFGDGATSIGASHEAANMAALWQLPVVFVCQHNQYGEHTRYGDYTATPSLAARFGAYGMASASVDGNSVPEMYQAAGEAIARARAGGGPTFLECQTFRLSGHSFGASTVYMDETEVAEHEANEPLGRYRSYLEDERGVDASVLDGIDKEVATAVDDAVLGALASEPPGADELLVDVFSDTAAVPR